MPEGTGKLANIRLDTSYQRYVENTKKSRSEWITAARRAIQIFAVWERKEMRNAFQKQQQPGGPRWAGNKGRYLEFKQRIGKTLAGVFTGELVQSIGEDIYTGQLRAIIGSGLRKAETFVDGAPPGMFEVNYRSKTYQFLLRRKGPRREFRPTDKWSARKLMDLVEKALGRVRKRIGA